jgi:hypothetical protein
LLSSVPRVMFLGHIENQSPSDLMGPGDLRKFSSELQRIGELGKVQIHTHAQPEPIACRPKRWCTAFDARPRDREQSPLGYDAGRVKTQAD